MITYEEIMKLGESTGYFINTLSKIHEHYINQYISETDITPGQYCMLHSLSIKPDATQSDIAKACSMDKCGVSRTFTEFEEKEIITREVNPENKRSYIIKLTPKGKEIINFLLEKERIWDEMISKELGQSPNTLLEKLKNISIQSYHFTLDSIYSDDTEK